MKIIDSNRKVTNMTDTKHFNGDIIITDPCYIIRSKYHGIAPITDDDWDACDYGYDMETLGITNYLTHDTLYGDWSCTTFDIDTKEAIGEFCADTGLVSVFQLDEVLKYNPDFDYHTERPWTTTLIKDFEGEVQIKVRKEKGVREGDTKYWKKGEEWVDYVCYVEGHGVNKITGEPINFITGQTGL